MKISLEALGPIWDQGEDATCVAMSVAKFADILYRIYLMETVDQYQTHEDFIGFSGGYFHSPQEIIDYFTSKLSEEKRKFPLKGLNLGKVMDYCINNGFPKLENCRYIGAQPFNEKLADHQCKERYYPFVSACHYYRLCKTSGVLRYEIDKRVGLHPKRSGKLRLHEVDIDTAHSSLLKVLDSGRPLIMVFAVGNYFRELGPNEVYNHEQSESNWMPAEMRKWEHLAEDDEAGLSFELEEKGYNHVVDVLRHRSWGPGNPIEKHAMVVYAYDDSKEEGEWDAINSWGSPWSNEGKCRIHRSSLHPFLNAAVSRFSHL